MRTIISIIMGVLILIAIPAIGASLRTLDGKSYDGEIRLDRGGYFLVVPRVGSLVRVEPGNVLDATFSTTSPPAMVKGVVMADGTALAASSIDSITDDSITLKRADGRVIVLPVEKVARVFFRATPVDQLAKIPTSAAGVLLSNGDFYEGQPRNFDGHSLKVESVLFGIATFETGDKAAVLVLRDSKKAAGNLIVRTVDGSVYSGDKFEVDGGNLKMNAQGVGAVTINGKDLAEIRTGGGRTRSLLDLTPSNIDGGDAKKVFAVDATTVGLPAKLLGEESQRAIGLSAGASVTYSLNGQYKLFICKAGVPMNLLPTISADFSVLVDGKPVFSGTHRSSIDEALSVGVKVAGANALTLKDEGAPGVWCDPLLVKAQP